MIGALVTPSLYRAASGLAGPVIDLYLARRRARGKEDAARFGERLGRASRPRPEGFLLWAHAASVGESLALVPLIIALGRERPSLNVLVTSGTVTSAVLLAERLPPFACHQYVPIDRQGPVRRFLDHWRPDLALWVESELWPNLVIESASRGVPMLLANAHMSAIAAARWARYPKLIRPMLAAFQRLLAQTDEDTARYRALGATAVERAGNLKYDAPPLAHDEAALHRLRTEIGERPIWLAASTHDGEETAALDAHRRLALRWPELLTVIVPRHPSRGDEIARLVEAAGLMLARRGRDKPISTRTNVYLADTLGELGLLYSLAPIVFVGGSLTPVGGHNAIEPARLGCALVAGPDMANFAELAAALRAADALDTVHDAASLADAVGALLGDPARRSARAAAALAVASSLGGALERTLACLLPLIPTSTPRPQVTR